MYRGTAITHKKEALLQWVSHFMTNPMFRIYSFICEKFKLAQASVLVLCTKFNEQIKKR